MARLCGLNLPTERPTALDRQDKTETGRLAGKQAGRQTGRRTDRPGGRTCTIYMGPPISGDLLPDEAKKPI